MGKVHSKTMKDLIEIFEPYLTTTRQYKDAKMELQEYTQKKYGCLPKYTLINKTGAENAPTFFVQVRVGNYVAEGQGSRKKLAEEDAAERMLVEICAERSGLCEERVGA